MPGPLHGRDTQATRPSPTRDDGAQVALAAAGLAPFSWDAHTDRLWISAPLAAMTGLPQGETPTRGGLAFEHLVPAEDRGAMATAYQGALAQDGGGSVRFRFVGEGGATRWLQGIFGTRRASDGRVLEISGVVRHLSAGEGGADPAALAREFDHRIKNLLASVQSLAAQSARHSVSLDDYLTGFLGRIDALAAVHTLLASSHWRGATIGAAAAAELGSLSPGRARWDGPEILLNPRGASALTLALHELAANALRFGALSTPEGRLEVRWRVLATGGFELDWLETDGPPVARPDRQGFGRTLLERVTGRELGGAVSLDFRPSGLCARLTGDATALMTPDPPATPHARAEAGDSSPGLGGASSGEAAVEDISGVRVLIVEDAVLLALELEAGLTEAGAEVVGVAADLEEARRLSELDFDVAVLDANLHGQSVMPLARALAARGTPFIFATGYRDGEDATEGFDAPVVRKPYNVRQIATALLAAIGRR